jgi:L-aspartate oxidase
LLEGLVFGARAAEAMHGPSTPAVMKADRVSPAPGPQSPHAHEQPIAPLDVAAIRDLMWRRVGLFRTLEGLEDAVRQPDGAYAMTEDLTARDSSDASAWRHFNLLTVARLIARAALRRRESRGGHFRQDFPSRDDLHWKVHFVDSRADR